MTKLTPATFDAITRAPHTHAREDRIIWTLPAIGRSIGRGKAFARTLARLPGSPIHQKGRQFYVAEAELIDFLRQKPKTGA